MEISARDRVLFAVLAAGHEMNDGDGNQLARIKVDETGVDLSVSRDVPSLFRRFLPMGWVARRDAEGAITARIVEKLRSGCGLDPAEEAFAVQMMGEHVSRYARLTAVQARAAQIVHRLPASATAPDVPGEAESQQDGPEARTSDDWLNKFREDASLVDDEVIREAYARILASEALTPNSISLRTLGVLRYLDRNAADAFSRILPLVLDGRFVPAQDNKPGNLIRAVGVDYETMLVLADAGLINETVSTLSCTDAIAWSIHLSGYTKWLLVKYADGRQFSASLRVHVFTPAGIQLARIAEPPDGGKIRDALVSWFSCSASDATTYVAPGPFGPKPPTQWRLWQSGA